MLSAGATRVPTAPTEAPQPQKRNEEGLSLLKGQGRTERAFPEVSRVGTLGGGVGTGQLLPPGEPCP